MIEKKIDDLGRIVLPATFRHRLGLDHGDAVNITVSSTCIMISPSKIKCAVCKKTIAANGKSNLCPDCILAVKEYQAHRPNNK